MVSKAAERKLIKFFFLAIGQAIPLFFRTQFRLKSDHYEMKTAFSEFIFSLDISELFRWHVY